MSLVDSKKMAKVALVVGATPENIMFAGSAVKDAPHHASVPGFVYTASPAGAIYAAKPTSICLYVVVNNQRNFSLLLWRHLRLPRRNAVRLYRLLSRASPTLRSALRHQHHRHDGSQFLEQPPGDAAGRRPDIPFRDGHRSLCRDGIGPECTV